MSDPTPTFAPVDPYAIEKELRQVQALMKLEQQEDLVQFKLKNAKASIQERQQRGLTWYPVTITQEDIGFGGKVVLELERPAGQAGLHLFQVGKNAALFGNVPGRSATDRPTLNGVITSVRRNKLRLATTKEDLPDWVTEGNKLGIDLTFDEVSYREMDYALGKVMGAYGDRLADLRDILLGAKQARFREEKATDLFYPSPLNESQLAAVRHVLAARDVAIIHGPPGTGKTRAVLRELAERLYKQDKQVLLAAYTNRAVDEICEQLVQAGLPFIRVGSRLGTAPVYRPYLLDNMLADCTSRQMVRGRLTTCPFYVGTVASLLGKPELFLLKQFDLAVVDEASQVLEAPMLALLAKVKKFILIGDHRQLPAVVAQEPETSAVAPEVAALLREHLGLTNLRNSYFERLFRRAEANWPHAHGTLADQYRMHQELAVLVNEDFYEGQLRCPLPWQAEPLARAGWPAASDDFTARLRGERVVFVPTRKQPEDLSMKESSQEAELAARAAAYVAQGYGNKFNPETTLGIIASYRNQAARIRARLAQLAVEMHLPALAQVSVDTVERYQGSQREVIIVSFCCHHEHQLELMVSPDETGQVDRKLNVALTRARQQLVLLGNETMLARAPHHAALLARVGAGPVAG